MGKLRHRVMEPLASHQAAPKWHSWVLNPGNLVTTAQGLSLQFSAPCLEGLEIEGPFPTYGYVEHSAQCPQNSLLEVCLPACWLSTISLSLTGPRRFFEKSFVIPGQVT